MAKLHDLGVAEAAKAIRTGDINGRGAGRMRCWRARRPIRASTPSSALEPDKVRAAAREADQRRASGALDRPAARRAAGAQGQSRHRRLSRPPAVRPASPSNRPKRNARDRAGVCSTPAPSCSANAICTSSPTGSPTTTPRFGPARNPYAPDRIPGGFERRHRRCGRRTACARAASARTPAARCASRRRCAALPVFARPPGAGRRPASCRSRTPAIRPGPMTRSVADCVLIDGVVTGGPTGSCSRLRLKGLRIGVPRRHFWENLDPELGADLRERAGAVYAMRASRWSMSI